MENLIDKIKMAAGGDFNNPSVDVKAYLVLTEMLAVLLLPCPAMSRQISVAGSLSIQQEYDSNFNRTPEEEQGAWSTVLSPELSISGEGINDHFALSYAPGFRINEDTGERDLDHRISLTVDRTFARRLTWTMSEDAVRSDDTYLVGGYERTPGALSLSGKLERRRFWSNDFLTHTAYEFGRDSVVELGYANRLLKNDGEAAGDYVEHNPYLSLAWRWAPRWRTEVSYNFNKGNFENSENISEHGIETRLGFQLGPHDQAFGGYNFSRTDFAGNEEDYAIHSALLGWQGDLDPHTRFRISGGGSYIINTTSSNDQTVNYEVDLERDFRRATVSVRGSGGYEELFYNGAADGLSRFWSVGGNIDYDFLQYLRGGVYASCRDDNFSGGRDQGTEKSYDGGLHLSWSVLRWYEISVRYDYHRLDADLAENEFTDHRLIMEIRAAREIWRW